MKKLVVLLLLLLWPGCAARGETWTIDTAYNPIYHVETFGAVLPDVCRDVLAGTPFAADAVLQGVMLREEHKNPKEVQGYGLLMAVEHEDTPLLIGGSKAPGGKWQVWPASETFLRDGEAFEITVKPNRDKNGGVISVFPAIAYGDEYYMIGNRQGYSEVYAYVHVDAQGNGLSIVASYPDYYYELVLWKDGKRTDRESYEVCYPSRLELVDADTFPRTADQLEKWSKEHSLVHEGVYVFAANLRERPTGKSKSLGVYHKAPAIVLDSAPGTQRPWYQLRIGDTVGWMSGVYVVNNPYDVNHGLAQVVPPSIAQCQKEISLYLSPSGQVKQTLPAGTAMHIIADCDGWYHVVLPQGDISWKLDAGGTYGYVCADDVIEYTTLVNMKYGIPAQKE